MKKITTYEISKTELEEYASKLAGKPLVMVEPADFKTFYFEEKDGK